MHIDLNLLRVAASLYRTGNVSKAGQELGLSQSAVSHALSRLRDQFKDPLFVRTSKGVQPTEFARGIQRELLEIVGRAELLAARKLRFDPLEAEGRITIATNDYFEAIVMPKLLPILQKEAPRLQISLRPTVGELPKRELETGKIDLAIAGFYEDLPEGYYQSKLFTDPFACAVGEKNPLSRHKRLSEDEYFEARHALITLQGDFRDSITRKVGAKKQHRSILYGSYSFTGIAWVLQSSDLLLTAPHHLLRSFQQYFPMRIWPCPVDLDQVEIQMIWHAQTHENPLRVWLRQKIKSVGQGFSDRRQPGPGPTTR